jgi:hypothetical protein
MKKQLIAALALALPLAGFAQGRGPGPGAGGGNGNATAARGDPQRMEKRMRLARTLGLAEALDLDAAQALKLGESIAKFDDRRLAAHVQMRDARQVLRRAAQGEKVAPAEVDAAIQKALDARAQIQAVDREIVATVTKDLAPDKKARAVLFLARFQSRFGGPGMHRGGMRGMGPGGGVGPGGGMRGGPDGAGGPGGMGMGPGGPGMMMGMAPPPGGPDDWDEED